MIYLEVYFYITQKYSFLVKIFKRYNTSETCTKQICNVKFIKKVLSYATFLSNKNVL